MVVTIIQETKIKITISIGLQPWLHCCIQNLFFKHIHLVAKDIYTSYNKAFISENLREAL